MYQEAKGFVKIIFRDRERTNLLQRYEQKALVFLVRRIPTWISSDMLTFIGFMGSLTILLSFVLANYYHKTFLLLGVLGFCINWFGDSLDGRLAYYRNKPRKWYGFSLDLIVDWLSTILIAWGYLIYARGIWEMVGFGFVVMYGWAMIIALIRYHVTEKYTIDSGLLGPTEVRIIISAILISEVLITDAILYSAAIASIFLFLFNLFDTLKLLQLANNRDNIEKLRYIQKN